MNFIFYRITNLENKLWFRFWRKFMILIKRNSFLDIYCNRMHKCKRRFVVNGYWQNRIKLNSHYSFIRLFPFNKTINKNKFLITMISDSKETLVKFFKETIYRHIPTPGWWIKCGVQLLTRTGEYRPNWRQSIVSCSIISNALTSPTIQQFIHATDQRLTTLIWTRARQKAQKLFNQKRILEFKTSAPFKTK